MFPNFRVWAGRWWYGPRQILWRPRWRVILFWLSPNELILSVLEHHTLSVRRSSSRELPLEIRWAVTVKWSANLPEELEYKRVQDTEIRIAHTTLRHMRSTWAGERNTWEGWGFIIFSERSLCSGFVDHLVSDVSLVRGVSLVSEIAYSANLYPDTKRRTLASLIALGTLLLLCHLLSCTNKPQT